MTKKQKEEEAEIDLYNKYMKKEVKKLLKAEKLNSIDDLDSFNPKFSMI